MALQWFLNVTEKVLSIVNSLAQKTVETVKKVACRCKQFLHGHFAGQHNTEKEMQHDQLKKTVEIVKTKYQHFLHQMVTRTRRCLNSMEHLDDTASENHQQQALPSRNTSFDILSDYLANVLGMIQGMIDQVNDCQEDVANEQSRMANHGLFQAFLDNSLTLLPVFLFNNILSRLLFPSLAAISPPLFAVITAFSAIYAAGHVIYPVYLDYTARNQMQHLEQELEGALSQIIDMLDVLGEVARLVYSHYELQYNESSEARCALENRIRYLLNQISLMAASYQEQED